jgi:hypothetical protein
MNDVEREIAIQKKNLHFEEEEKSEVPPVRPLLAAWRSPSETLTTIIQ